MEPKFKTRAEYEKWKSEKLREAAESDERKRDKKAAHPEVLADSEPKKRTADLFREPPTIPEPNGSTMVTSKLTKCEDCGKDVSRRAEQCPHCGAPLQIQESESLGQTVRAATTERIVPVSTNFKTCKTCGTLVDKRAGQCPTCGAPMKSKFNRPLGCLGTLLGVGLLLYLCSYGYKASNESKVITQPSNQPSVKQNVKKIPEFTIHQRCKLGDFEYLVQGTKWSEVAPGVFKEQTASESFLIIEIEIWNFGKEPKTIPSFRLVDESGAEYEVYEKSYLTKGTIGGLERLNPDMRKEGIVVFDVPKKKYKLKVSSSLIFGNYALIIL